ncbi:extracellular solute-binding protein [Amycolatopsis sp. K13G38]|uniref:Extracellular solute-binding protein n=1 Tax=Amycolatopsis acididurans TaxID=2724524 RepID=A0ABX1JGC2_9PSEU|nr:extracellular solute-binding protein [Amycolatopsis acididurans]NKQ57815.1 extracellular solute-binding protein [Amycolatopsis acididurans]
MLLSHRRGAVAAMTALVTAATLTLTACSSSGGSGSAGPIVIANWGGAPTKAYQSAYLDPFTAETGIAGQQVDAPGVFVARAEAQAKASRVQWDILESITGVDTAHLANEGLLDPVPPDVKDRLVRTVGKENVTDYGYHSGSTAMLIVCNTQRVPVCPQNMQEFWDVHKFPQKRALIGINPVYPIAQAQIALGVPRDKVASTPIDVDATFAKLKELRPFVSVFYTSSDQGTQVLQQGEADMAIFYATRIYDELLPQGNYKVVWTDGVLADGTSVVLKDAPNKAAAWQLMEWIADHPEQQAKFALAASKAAVDPKALDYMPADKREQFSNAPEHNGQLATPNIADFTAKFDEINRRWQEFIAG